MSSLECAELERSHLFEAVQHVAAKDRRLAQVIEKVGECRLHPDEMQSPFQALAESIVYQQLTGKAAASIFARVCQLFGEEAFEPQHILVCSEERLRSAGLSRAKSLALKDLAEKTIQGTVPTLAEMALLSDGELIERLITIRGVGLWTVEMLLIFRLGRLDVLPATDYGIRKGFAKTFRTGDLPTPKQIIRHGERWKPYRTIASWYLWRALEV